MAQLEAGRVHSLLVDKTTVHGYVLSNGGHTVLLPFPEALGRKLVIGESVDAFLYHDSEDRFTATFRTPFVQFGQVARLQVVDIHPSLGCFLEFGLLRHVLMPLSELPAEPSIRPLVGDEVFIRLDRDKEGRLLARAIKEEDLRPYVFHAPLDWRNRWMEAWVYRSLQSGSLVVVDGGVLGFGAIGFIPSPERTRAIRIGEKVEVRVTFVREDGHVNLSMRQRKEASRDEDAEKLLEFLRTRPNGAMPYSDQTPAELIMKRFEMSKSAFKRALGKLMKEGIVTQKDNWTHLREPEGSNHV
jgi:predicted RNA-binding protein (virulence factor B family)